MSLDVVISPALPTDAGELLVVQRSAYVSEAQWYDAPRIPPLVETLDEVVAAIAAGGVLVARLGSRLVGSVRWEVAGGLCHVNRLSVATDLQGHGLGSRLLTAAGDAADAPAYTLFTGADSPHNIRLYERHGYVATHTEQHERWAFVHMTKVRPAPSA
ncbi:GNAT family N-acetyltransferase [Acidothermaceae bacterium B102]|nr:GNAT family N-acetyltransferase [Acidothermaceae bacterium B102]